MSRHHDKIKNDSRWKAARLACLQRDDHACVVCGDQYRLEVNHIQRLADGGDPFDLDNLETLCQPHHEQVERNRVHAVPEPDRVRVDWTNPRWVAVLQGAG